MKNDTNTIFRRQIYWILILISSGLIFGRIIAVDNVNDRAFQGFKIAQIDSRMHEKEQRLISEGRDPDRIAAEMAKTENRLIADALRARPTLSANDRSRWCTIRALVEPEMRVTRTVDGKEEIVWFAIDKVQDELGWDTIDMCKHGFPNDPEKQEFLFSTKPPLLPILMSVPYAILFNASGGEINMYTHPFFIVRLTLILCNLLPIIFCWWLMSKMIEKFGTTDWGRIFAMGTVCFGTFVSTFAVTINNHLPGVFCITIATFAAVKIWFDGELKLRYFALCGFFAMLSVHCEMTALIFTAMIGLPILFRYPKQTLIASVPAVLLVAAAFIALNYAAHKQIIPAYGESDWYSYTYTRGGVERISYWDNRDPIDLGEKSIPTYILHSTVGHHGIFSLTPVWILSFFGIGYWVFQRRDPKLRDFAIVTILMSIIVFAFYMQIPQVQRNYGGVCSGFRWMFWFIPLWSITMLPVVDKMSKSRFLRGLALVLLIISVASVAYPLWNPWSQPWIYYLLDYLGVPILGAPGYVY